MTEQSATYNSVLQEVANRDNLLRCKPLSEAELSVVVLMRDIAGRKQQPMLVLQYLGNAWRIHETLPGKRVE